MKVVITYGTYDVFHYGHFEHLRESKKLGDYLIVGVSTDEFNTVKGKQSLYSYEKRKEMVEAIKFVDLVIPETDWDQKEGDIKKHNVNILTMGDDWSEDARFERLREFCEVIYTPGARTLNRLSSTKIREGLKLMDK